MPANDSGEENFTLKSLPGAIRAAVPVLSEGFSATPLRTFGVLSGAALLPLAVPLPLADTHSSPATSTPFSLPRKPQLSSPFMYSGSTFCPLHPAKNAAVKAMSSTAMPAASVLSTLKSGCAASLFIVNTSPSPSGYNIFCPMPDGLHNILWQKTSVYAIRPLQSVGSCAILFISINVFAGGAEHGT